MTDLTSRAEEVIEEGGLGLGQGIV